MPDAYLLIDLVVVIALCFLGLAVLLRNNAAELNQFFAIFVLCIGVWIIANYISNDTGLSTQVATIANYFVFFFSYAAAVYLLRFVISLSGDKRSTRLFYRLRLPFYTIGLASFSPLVVLGVKLQGSVYAVKFGVMSSSYFIALFILIAGVLYVLRRNIRRSTGAQKGRLEILFWSMCLTLPFLMLTEAVLPAVTGWFGLTNIGVLPMLILVAGLYYATARHRLFNLRLLIVRSLVYAITLAAISLLYGVVSYFVANTVARLQNGFFNATFQVLLIVAVAISYQPLKRLFDKLTNKIFYRDAYDPQLLMDELNRALVSNIELSQLLSVCASIIAAKLKTQRCSFWIEAPAATGHRQTFGGGGLKITVEDSKVLHDFMLSNKDDYSITEFLPAGMAKIRRVLEALDIAVMVQLSPEMATTHGGLRGGFLMIGQKQSGNIYTQQDLQTLAIIANELVIAIQNALRFEEIQRFNLTLQEEVDTATRKLKRQNKRLEELDNIKDDFISMASHQLRTPLTSVKGYLSMVLEGDAGTLNPMQGQMLKQAFTSSQRMVFLITDLLNVSRLKTGKFIIDAAPANLSEIVEQELAQLQETAQAKNIKLTYERPASLPPLMLDEVKIRQVIMNFVDNAIYYTNEGGNIRVELDDKPSTVELRVIDNGIGVPKSEQHHLFTKFYRATNARKARPDGTGLGLFMAAKVIVAQGGSIIFSSKEGQGSTFGFAFSKSRLKAPASGAKPETSAEISAPQSSRVQPTTEPARAS